MGCIGFRSQGVASMQFLLPLYAPRWSMIRSLRSPRARSFTLTRDAELKDILHKYSLRIRLLVAPTPKVRTLSLESIQ